MKHADFSVSVILAHFLSTEPENSIPRVVKNSKSFLIVSGLTEGTPAVCSQRRTVFSDTPQRFASSARLRQRAALAILIWHPVKLLNNARPRPSAASMRTPSSWRLAIFRLHDIVYGAYRISATASLFPIRLRLMSPHELAISAVMHTKRLRFTLFLPTVTIDLSRDHALLGLTNAQAVACECSANAQD